MPYILTSDGKRVTVEGQYCFFTESETNLLTGLQAYWKFEETSGSIVDEIDSLTATNINTAAIYSVGGIIDNAITFNYLPTYGNGTRFRVSSSNPLRLPKITVSIWVYPDNIDDGMTIISNCNYVLPMNQGFRISCAPAAGVGAQLNVTVHDAASTSLTIGGGNYITHSAWNHIVFTSDGEMLRLYNNNIELDSSSFAYDIGYLQDSSIVIGGTWDGNSFGGRIDELGVWDRALSTSEISQLYNGGAGLAYPFS